MTRHRSPRVRDFWGFLLLMQSHIDGGVTPNRAAVLVANEHWRKMPAPTYEACVAWLKRCQRQFRDELRSATWKERVDAMWKRMEEENERWLEEWRAEHGLDSGLALQDLENLLKERDQENPHWRAQWRARYGRDPDAPLAFFRILLGELSAEDADAELDEDPIAERKEFVREPVD